MKVKAVLRFWYEGKLVEPGDEIEVDDSLGREVIASGKAVGAAEEPAPAAKEPEEKSRQRKYGLPQPTQQE